MSYWAGTVEFLLHGGIGEGKNRAELFETLLVNSFGLG